VKYMLSSSNTQIWIKMMRDHIICSVFVWGMLILVGVWGCWGKGGYRWNWLGTRMSATLIRGREEGGWGRIAKGTGEMETVAPTRPRSSLAIYYKIFILYIGGRNFNRFQSEGKAI
jgi:hypothetical protein